MQQIRQLDVLNLATELLQHFISEKRLTIVACSEKTEIQGLLRVLVLLQALLILLVKSLLFYEDMQSSIALAN